MTYSFRHTNPELTGTIVKEKVRCGKSNCRCMKQNKSHKWYYYLYWRKGKLLKKYYLPKTKVRTLKRKIILAKTKDKEEKNRLKFYQELYKQIS